MNDSALKLLLDQLKAEIKAELQPQPDVLDAKEAAEYLRISYWKVVTDAKKGILPSFNVGARVLFRRDSLDEWMKQQEQLRCVKRSKIRKVG